MVYRIILLLSILSCGYCTQDSNYIVDSSGGYGRTFDGIGAISGGGALADIVCYPQIRTGQRNCLVSLRIAIYLLFVYGLYLLQATSKLLMNYPDPERSDILDFLFMPNYGASLHIFKVEIGGDMQSTEGTEASHMHNSWDLNFDRGYEWWLMKEAKKRNPDIKLYGLPWGFPGFLRDAEGTPWGNIQHTADYIVTWVKGAKEHHKLNIDFIGIWNESPYNISYIKTLRKTLNDAGFSKTKIIAADGKWDIADDIARDQQLADAVHAIGTHYPGTFSDTQAVSTNKPLWASEDWGCTDPIVGPGCLARTLNQNYVNGYMTSTIIWNIISSYYYGLPWYGSGLMTASEPWSGHYIVAPNIWVTAHTTQFTQIGWKYLKHGSGVGKLNGGGSYVVLVSPDEKDFTIIIETMSHDNSICVRPPLPPYNVAGSQTAMFDLKGSLAKITQKLNVWYSRIGYDELIPVSFQKQDQIQINNGTIKLNILINELWTLTTVSTGYKGSVPFIPEPQPFSLPYKEDFESYNISQEPFDFSQQVGSFEVDVMDGNKFMKQAVLEPPVHWFYCQIDKENTTLNVFGDYNWKDIHAEVNVMIPTVNGSKSVYLAVRATTAGCRALLSSGLFFFFYPTEHRFVLSTDLLQKNVLTQGNIAYVKDSWNNLSLTVKGNQLSGYVNSDFIFNVTVPVAITNGWVAFGSYPFGLAYFDDVFIYTVD
ncbi:hypothetical protein LOTGIDRAFT_174010 [Lottia gigantea]|uniref:galactosylceramidase n=1 Tax=Lottia gigantea TaxID=225164 RepID=V4AZ55_LOTGI|nr:hypothetical protein LOTGIDRAFT_174010 [Lottia gigantea]ESO99011.1 hypothetical protein LOTGIDRAFT_174010 [Lottia gigantea]